ncbi:MAG TPA: tetratricopeptide repeat protein [Candidatus Cybelea sp.]|nr:tetratricopeptide repeat protein [Candidatus Cybelea sp.]
MPRRYALARIVIGAVVAAIVLAFGTIQLASDALSASAAAPRTLPHSIPPRFGRAVYRVLDAVAPAPYVETTLAQDALARRDPDAAQHYAIRLPASPVRDELLARVAAARGEHALAAEYLLAAPDPVAIDAIAQSIAARDPAAAFALERLLRTRLARDGTHPDAIAEADWQMGRLANRQAWREVPGSSAQRAWLEEGLRDFGAAVELAPLSERYVVEAANQADLLGARDRAERLFAHAADIDPRSADAIAGLGVIAWQTGDRQAAAAYLARARAIDPGALMVQALERDLR